jgi:hypothetical protein
MKVLSFLAAILLNFPNTQMAQQSAASPQRDSQAVALLQDSIRAMGGNVPRCG